MITFDVAHNGLTKDVKGYKYITILGQQAARKFYFDDWSGEEVKNFVNETINGWLNDPKALDAMKTKKETNRQFFNRCLHGTRVEYRKIVNELGWNN